MFKTSKIRKKLLNKIHRPRQDVQDILLDRTQKWPKRHRMRTLRKKPPGKWNRMEVVHGYVGGQGHRPTRAFDTWWHVQKQIDRLTCSVNFRQGHNRHPTSLRDPKYWHAHDFWVTWYSCKYLLHATEQRFILNCKLLLYKLLMSYIKDIRM